MTYTMPDEHSAQLRDVEAAEAVEDTMHGRPYEAEAVRHGGLFRDLRARQARSGFARVPRRARSSSPSSLH